MTKKAAKQKNAQSFTQARRSVLGLTLRWTDKQPLFESINHDSISKTSISHKNPIQSIVCLKMWNMNKVWIVEQEFTWLVTVKVVYKSNRDGDDKVDTIEIRCTGALRWEGDQRINEATEKKILESRLNNYLTGETQGYDHKSFGIFDRCEFEAVIVGI
ncbi:MAG: hypothetical protein V4440_03090 [Pseudomonadota bacterium]